MSIPESSDLILFAISVFGAVIGFWLNRMDKKFDKLELKIDTFRSELKSDIKIQAARSDRLYEMFYELLKEGKCK